VRFLLCTLALLLALLAAVAGYAWWWLDQPLATRQHVLELEIAPGTPARAVAQAAVRAGVQTDERLLYAWFRLSGRDTAIKAGNYEITHGISPRALLDKLVRGSSMYEALTIVEGWNWRQLRQALALTQSLRPDSAALSDAALMQLHQRYPEYGFDRHKGYGTALHLERLAQHGPCPEHRRSFAPVRACLERSVQP